MADRALLSLARTGATDWARRHGDAEDVAAAFGNWFVRTYPDSRFQPTHAEAHAEFLKPRGQ